MPLYQHVLLVVSHIAASSSLTLFYADTLFVTSLPRSNTRTCALSASKSPSGLDGTRAGYAAASPMPMLPAIQTPLSRARDAWAPATAHAPPTRAPPLHTGQLSSCTLPCAPPRDRSPLIRTSTGPAVRALCECERDAKQADKVGIVVVVVCHVAWARNGSKAPGHADTAAVARGCIRFGPRRIKILHTMRNIKSLIPFVIGAGVGWLGAKGVAGTHLCIHTVARVMSSTARLKTVMVDAKTII